MVRKCATAVVMAEFAAPLPVPPGFRAKIKKILAEMTAARS